MHINIWVLVYFTLLIILPYKIFDFLIRILNQFVFHIQFAYLNLFMTSFIYVHMPFNKLGTKKVFAFIKIRIASVQCQFWRSQSSVGFIVLHIFISLTRRLNILNCLKVVLVSFWINYLLFMLHWNSEFLIEVGKQLWVCLTPSSIFDSVEFVMLTLKANVDVWAFNSYMFKLLFKFVFLSVNNVSAHWYNFTVFNFNSFMRPIDAFKQSRLFLRRIHWTLCLYWR